MIYTPNTPDQQREMLATIGLDSAERLFDVIPAGIRRTAPLDLPPAMAEMELQRHMEGLAAANLDTGRAVCFLGGGSYDHFIPAVVDVIGSRSEYYTAYTPYQAEASQGTLQVGFEFQTLVCQLTGMDVANASMYEAATAAVEAALMARAVSNRPARIAASAAVHPEYLETLRTYLVGLGAELVVVPAPQGRTEPAALAAALGEDVSCVLLQSPNFFGLVEPMTELVAAARPSGAAVIQVFDPISLGILKRPGDVGADIAVAEGHTLGTPMQYGGPFLGLFACRERFLRKLPGRVVGQTVDREGRRAFVLTLQTREQHIRREKATSNICTNQGLMALRASTYLAALGPQGLRETALLCHEKAKYAAARLAEVPGLSLAFEGAFFKEFTLRTPGDAEKYLPRLAEMGYHAGVPLGRLLPDRADCLLVAVTEKRTRGEIDGLAAAWRKALA